LVDHIIGQLRFEKSIAGKFEEAINVDNFENPHSTNPSSNILSAIPEMGLHLQQAKGLVTTFVIDQAEPPSPN